MTPNPTELPLDPRPRVVEVAGLQLSAKLAALQAQGARVSVMENVRNEPGLWRLRLVWDDADGPKTSPVPN